MLGVKTKFNKKEEGGGSSSNESKSKSHSALSLNKNFYVNSEIHLAFAENISREFVPEDFSLHYQRSLFSSMVSLVRETWQSMRQQTQHLPASVQARFGGAAEPDAAFVKLYDALRETEPTF